MRNGNHSHLVGRRPGNTTAAVTQLLEGVV
jgi:hypothetical protein